MTLEASTGREDLVALTVESAAMAKVPLPGCSLCRASRRGRGGTAERPRPVHVGERPLIGLSARFERVDRLVPTSKAVMRRRAGRVVA